MKKELTKLSVAAVAVVIGLTVGCATTSDLEKLKQRVVEVENTANEANRTAQSAESTANAASARSEEAMAVGVAATATGEEGAACCIATNEKIDRMFGRMQQK